VQRYPGAPRQVPRLIFPHLYPEHNP
jgi:hypothetical protein